MLVSLAVQVGSTPERFALGNFIKSTLHAFTGTLAVECERLARMFHQSLLYGPGGASDRAIWAFLMV
jgi:hypothetical protein